MDWPNGVIGDRLVNDSNAVLLANGEYVEEPVVRGQRDVQIVKLLFVLVNVHGEPAPVAVPVVVVGVPVQISRGR